MSYESFGGDSCGWEERSFRSKRQPRPSVVAQPPPDLRFLEIWRFEKSAIRWREVSVLNHEVEKEE